MKSMEDELYYLQHSPVANRDLENISIYIADTLGNISAAIRFMAKLNKSVGQLKAFPYIGSKVEDAYFASKGYRKLVVDNYLVFYLVDDERRIVNVMRVLHGAREYRNLL